MRHFAFQSTMLLIVAVASGSGIATAAPILYGDFTGGGVGDASFIDVTEDSLTDGTPLFEAPMALSNSLVFMPIGFGSAASNGATDSTIGSLTMTIRADAGFSLGRIIIDETADTTLLGSGTSATFSSIATALEIIDLVPGIGGALNDDVLFAPGSLFELPIHSFVDINGDLIIDLTGLGITEASFSLEHTLMTGSEAGTTAFIQSKSFGISVESVPVPEPTTLSLLGLVTAIVLRRRRTR